MKTLPVRPDKRRTRQPAALKVGVAATVAPSSHILVLGTNTFVLKTFFTFFCSFDRRCFVFRLSSFVFVLRCRSQNLHLSISFGKVLTFGVSANVNVIILS
jgi:hypothetical protein